MSAITIIIGLSYSLIASVAVMVIVLTVVHTVVLVLIVDLFSRSIVSNINN